MSNDRHEDADLAEVLEVASKAGHILLENGAEISRVEDIMSRISSHFGVDSGNFFVLSNGIFTTGRANKVTKSGAQASTYANVEFIPLRGIQLSKVVAVNRLSYDISNGRTNLAEARERLERRVCLGGGHQHLPCFVADGWTVPRPWLWDYYSTPSCWE